MLSILLSSIWITYLAILGIAYLTHRKVCQALELHSPVLLQRPRLTWTKRDTGFLLILIFAAAVYIGLISAMIADRVHTW
jgi:hypothetical protein